MADVLRTAFSSAWSRKRRLLGTSLSVVLGVAFLMATLVIGDSARAGFDVAFTKANAGIDAVVRNEARISGGDGVDTTPIDAALLDVVSGLDGVTATAPLIEAPAQILDDEGKTLGGDGPPTIGAAWVEDPDLTGWDIADGRAPTGPGEVVIDRASADDAGFAIGDPVTVLTPEPTTSTLVGIATFGDDDSIGGSTYAAFSLPVAQDLLLGRPDRVTSIAVATDGDADELVAHLESSLPDGIEAISAADLTAEQKDDIEGDFLGVLTTALLVFAAVAMLVASFSIYNTFSILAAQRTRESALLRMLGASRRQVLGAALIEAVAIGALGSALGLGAGALLAEGLVSLLASSEFGLPLDGAVISSGALIAAGIVGLVVTVGAGLGPAVRASRVAPLAVLRETAVDRSHSSRTRMALGGLTGVAGVALVLLAGAAGALPQMGLGALLVVVGMVLLGPIAAGPVGRVLGAPLELRGVPGELAQRNAARNPRRTAGTAASLLVGVGVVTLFTVFGSSMKASIEDAVDRSFGGDLVVEGGGFSGAGLSIGALDDIAALPEVADVSGLGWGMARLDGAEREVGFADLAALERIADFDVVEGDLADVDDDGFAISTDKAEHRGWGIGDTVEAQFVDGATVPLTVAAIYDDRAMGGDLLLPAGTWSAHVPATRYAIALVNLEDGVSLDDGLAAVERTVEPYGRPEVQDRDGFIESEASEINTLLGIIYGLLGIAIVIALLGIANTLSLSIHERTRELGLLRAVGQSKSQVRAMVRWESVLVALFGALGGIGTGVFLGWGLVRAMHEAEGFGTLDLPTGSLVTVLVVGAVAGVIAGLRPAAKAARLDVLQALAAT